MEAAERLHRFSLIRKVTTFPENWDSKAPSIGTLLVYVETIVQITVVAHLIAAANLIEYWSVHYSVLYVKN